MGSIIEAAGDISDSIGLNDLLGIGQGPGGTNFGADNSPGARGFGIQDPGTPFQEYNTGPGLQQGTRQAGDWDMRGPGAGEAYWNNTRTQFALQPDQSRLSNFWDNVQGQFGPDAGRVSTPLGTNNSQSAYENIANRQSTLAPDAGINAYYDRAVADTTGDINSQLASRGLFGSSAGLEQLGDAASGLRAQQARDNADYRLRADQSAQGWSGLATGAAGQADQIASNLFRNDIAGSQNALSWLTGGANIAQGADAARLANIMGGANIAATAQNQRRDRVQDYFNNVSNTGMFMTDFANQGYNAMFADDAQNFGNSIMFGTGMAADAVNRSDRQQGQNRQGASDLFSIMGGDGISQPGPGQGWGA